MSWLVHRSLFCWRGGRDQGQGHPLRGDDHGHSGFFSCLLGLCWGVPEGCLQGRRFIPLPNKNWLEAAKTAAHKLQFFHIPTLSRVGDVLSCQISGRGWVAFHWPAGWGLDGSCSSCGVSQSGSVMLLLSRTDAPCAYSGLRQSGAVSAVLTSSNLRKKGIKPEMSIWIWLRSVELRWWLRSLSRSEWKQQTGTYAMSCIFISETIRAVSNEPGYNLTGRAASTDCLYHCMTLSDFTLFITPRIT